MNDYISTKLAIYESCDAGYITESERADLLEILEASKEEDSDSAKKAETQKKIKKCIKICTIITVLIGAAAIAIKVADNKMYDRARKIERQSENEAAGKAAISTLNSYKEKVSALKFYFMEEEKQIRNSENYGLTDKGRAEMTEKVGELKRIYNDVHSYTKKLDTSKATDAQRTRIEALIKSIDDMINHM